MYRSINNNIEEFLFRNFKNNLRAIKIGLSSLLYQQKCSLLSSIKQFENKCIFWYTDNFATQQIITCGSNKTPIHLLALNIFSLTFDHNIHLEVLWVGREYNKEADKISKTIDFDD